MVGPGARIHIVEAFARNPKFLVDEIATLEKRDEHGARMVKRVLGVKVFELSNEFVAAALHSAAHVFQCDGEGVDVAPTGGGPEPGAAFLSSTRRVRRRRLEHQVPPASQERRCPFECHSIGHGIIIVSRHLLFVVPRIWSTGRRPRGASNKGRGAGLNARPHAAWGVT